AETGFVAENGTNLRSKEVVVLSAIGDPLAQGRHFVGGEPRHLERHEASGDGGIDGLVLDLLDQEAVLRLERDHVELGGVALRVRNRPRVDGADEAVFGIEGVDEVHADGARRVVAVRAPPGEDRLNVALIADLCRAARVPTGAARSRRAPLARARAARAVVLFARSAGAPEKNESRIERLERETRASTHRPTHHSRLPGKVSTKKPSES